MKGSAWLKLLGYSNSLCVRATRAITNHTPIGKYCLRFFSKENFNCPTSTVHADHIQSSQDVIFFMNAEDLITIGILTGSP